MNARADAAWVDALAGRGDDGSVDAAFGRMLRRAVVANAAMPEAAAAALDPHREDELVARARREGIIPARSGMTAAWRIGWRAAVAAAVVVGAVGLVLHVRKPVPHEPVRGGGEGVVRLESADPPAFQRDLIRDLRRAGVEARGYELLGRSGVDADLPQPVPPEVRRILETRGIRLPEDGALRVEIRLRAGR